MVRLELLFVQELNEMIKRGACSEERKRRLESWVQKAETARNSGSLDAGENQYDKSEEILTWYTFAPLFRMIDEQQRILTINEILEPLVGPNAIASRPRMTLERAIRPSTEYLHSRPPAHPVRYIREKVEEHLGEGQDLEGDTFVDFFIESDELVIPIEAKFTSDIGFDVEYNCIRNQIARTIDAAIETAKRAGTKKRVVFLLCVPRRLHNEGRFYFYKMKDYENVERLKHDLPHQSDSIDTYFRSARVVYWEDVASVIVGNAVKWGLLNEGEIDALKEFYEERLIELSTSLP